MDEQRQRALRRRLSSRRPGTSPPPISSSSHCLSNAPGPQFSLGFFFFIDAATFSKSALNGSEVHINFVDWIPGVCSALGMLVINTIDKSRLGADTFSYSGNGVAWKARLVLFMGFALMAGGLAGAVVSCGVLLHRVERKADGQPGRLSWCSNTWCPGIRFQRCGSVSRTWLRMPPSCSGGSSVFRERCI